MSFAYVLLSRTIFTTTWRHSFHWKCFCIIKKVENNSWLIFQFCLTFCSKISLAKSARPANPGDESATFATLCWYFKAFPTMEFFAYPRFFNCIVVFKLSVTRAAVVVECATTKKRRKAIAWRSRDPDVVCYEWCSSTSHKFLGSIFVEIGGRVTAVCNRLTAQITE